MGNRTTGRYGKGTAAKLYFLEQTVGKRTLPRKKGWEYYCNQLRSLGTQGHQHWHLVSFCLLPGLIIRFLFPCCCEKNWQCSEMMVTGSNDKCSLGHWEFLCSILTEIEKGFCTYLIFAPSVAVCCQGELRFELAICIHFAIWPIKIFIPTNRRRKHYWSRHFLLDLSKTVYLWAGWAVISLWVMWQFTFHSWVIWSRWEAKQIWTMRKGTGVYLGY